MNLVKAMLHLEGLAVLIAAVWFYFTQLEASWVAFAVLLLVPDVSMVGFLRNVRLGAITYNAVHNYVLIIATLALGLALGSDAATGLGLILAAHVGMDRALGYGLKYPTAFVHTHLQRAGQGSEVGVATEAAGTSAGLSEMRTA